VRRHCFRRASQLQETRRCRLYEDDGGRGGTGGREVEPGHAQERPRAQTEQAVQEARRPSRGAGHAGLLLSKLCLLLRIVCKCLRTRTVEPEPKIV